MEIDQVHSNAKDNAIDMTKKEFATVAIVLTVALAVFFWNYLPMEIMGGYRVGNTFMRLFFSGFIALTMSLIIVFPMIVTIKRDYANKQLETLKRFRHLLLLMVKRDFVTRYRRSVLGVLWSVLNPLFTMIILTMVFSTIFESDIPNFPIYIFTGQLIYNFYAEATNGAMSSVISGATIIKKLYVPKYIFPISKIFSAVINLGFSFVAFILVFLVLQTPFHWTMLLIPVPMLYVFIFAMGVGMILSSLAVFFRDITHLYGVIVTMLFFLTPIMYPVNILPQQMFHLIHLNPLFHYIEYFRDLALNGTIPGLWSNIVCLGFSFGTLAIGVYVKMTHQDKYILYL